MKTGYKHILYCLLTACYFLVATIGNVVALNELLNSGDKQHQLTSEKKSREIPVSPVWTVKKHILPTFHSDISEHDVSYNKVSLEDKSPILFVNNEIALIYSSLEFLPSKPRDPPLA